MFNTLHTELYKLKLNRMFWSILTVALVLNTLMHYLAITGWWQIYNTPFEAAGIPEMNGLSMFMAPLFFNLMIGTLAAFYISVEFNASGVIKNQIISGESRAVIYFFKYLVYTFASILIVVVVPLTTGIIVNVILGNASIFSLGALLYLLGGFLLYTLQLSGFTAIIMLIAILTNDSGKTIIFSIIFTLIMFVIERMPIFSFVETIYDYSIFQQFNIVLEPNLGAETVITSIIVGCVYLVLILVIGKFVFSKKEIK